MPDEIIETAANIETQGDVSQFVPCETRINFRVSPQRKRQVREWVRDAGFSSITDFHESLYKRFEVIINGPFDVRNLKIDP